jgi:membrane-associated phospholipid phosphatase
MSIETSGADGSYATRWRWRVPDRRRGAAQRFPWPSDQYRQRALLGTLTCLVLLGALTTTVALGLTDGLDVWARERFRPNFIWGENQRRASHVVFWLDSERMVLLLALGSAGVCVWRLTAWPLVRSACAVTMTAGLTIALKELLHRGDPGGQHTSLGGSFPSGHSAILLVCVATGAMIVSCPTRWSQRVGILLLEAVLAVGMLFITLHWLTDIVGGALVGGVVLGVLALVAGPDGGRSHRGRRHRLTRRRDRSSSPPHRSQTTDTTPVTTSPTYVPLPDPGLVRGSSDLDHRP